MDEINIQQKESIKLMKMSKGYQWEIKVLSNKLTNTEMKRLDDINSKLERGYGNDGKDTGNN